jgi:hypothetical protein
MGMDKILVWVVGILVVLCIVVAGVFLLPALGQGGVPPGLSAAEQGCLASGGTVGESVCCASIMGFPNTCVVGACACSAEFSHAVKTCNCPGGTCFNGTACTKVIASFVECVAAGYPVMESYPRQCHVPGGLTFVEEIPIPMTAESCTAARGHWNDCSSRCQIDNQGKSGIACPALCESLCECGGIAGFGCPEGYTCKMPAGIADALGYCVAG